MATPASAPMIDQNVSKFVAKTQKILINDKVDWKPRPAKRTCL